MTTIKDVSRIAGVSFKTVSRVLNNEKGVVSEKRNKVLSAVTQTGYVPNTAARSLKSGKTNVIGILAHSLKLEISVRKLHALQDALHTRGYDVFIVIKNSSHCDYSRCISRLESGTDGIIFLDKPPLPYLQKLKKIHKPFVLVDSAEGIFPEVSINRGKGIEEASALLCKKYDSFILLTSKGETRSPFVSAFRRAMRTHYTSKPAHILYFNKIEFDDTYKKLRTYRLPRKPLIFCRHDRAAFGAIKALMDRGIAVPQAAGVIGFDDDTYCRYAPIPVSSISQSVEKLADETISILLDHTSGKVPCAHIDTFFCRRQSC